MSFYEKLIALVLSFLCLFSALPVGAVTFGVNAEGINGEAGGIVWQYDSGTLTVKPNVGVENATMPNYYDSIQRPWNDYSSLITNIVVEEGVVYIGAKVFSGTAVETL